MLGISRTAVSRWVKYYKDSENLLTKPGRGRKPILSRAAGERALELLLSNEYCSAKEVAKQLQKDGMTLNGGLPHSTTIIRHAKAAAIATKTPIRAARGKPGKQLTKDTRAKRLAFVNANKGRNWSSVMFTDRKKFFFQYPGTAVRIVQWLKKGEKRTAFKPNHPMGLNVYAGNTKWGITKCHIVSGSNGHKTTFQNKKGQPSPAKSTSRSWSRHCCQRAGGCSLHVASAAGLCNKTMILLTRRHPKKLWQPGTRPMLEARCMFCPTGLPTVLT